MNEEGCVVQSMEDSSSSPTDEQSFISLKELISGRLSQRGAFDRWEGLISGLGVLEKWWEGLICGQAVLRSGGRD